MLNQIKNLGIGLFLAQIISVVNQILIGRLYKPDDLGSYQLAIQVSALFALIYFLRREYFIVEIKNKISAYYLLITTINKRKYILLFSSVLAIIYSITFDSDIDFQIVLFAILIGVLLSYNVAFQQILEMKGEFLKSGFTETIQKISFLILLILLHFSNEKFLNPILVSFSLALLIRNFFSRYQLKLIFLKTNINRFGNHVYQKYSKQIEKGKTLSKNNFIGIVSGLGPSLYISSTYGLEKLGLFSMSITLLSLPSTIISNSVSNVLYQNLSTSYGLTKKTRNSIILTLLILSLLFLLLYPFGKPLIIDILLGEKWTESIDVIFLLIPAMMSSFISKPFERTCYLFEKKKWHIISILIKSLLVVFSITLSFFLNYDFLQFIKLYSAFLMIHYCTDLAYNFRLLVLHEIKN